MAETSVNVIPALTDAEIQARVGQQSFQRGKQYFRDGSIFSACQQGLTLKGRSHGSQGRAYRLHITFRDGQIASANCSCPVGEGGHCKHIAALLLTWRERPEEFLEVEELDSALEQRSKEELVVLVKQMLKQEPELESLLEVPLPVAGKRSISVDPEIYRRQAAAAFSGTGYEWEPPDDVEEKLLAIASIGDGFAKQQDYASAATVYEAVVRESLKNYQEYQDESGSLAEVISECVGGLGTCLFNQQEPAAREGILRTLFEVYRFDLDFGGIGMSDEALELIFEQATREERRVLAGWAREVVPAGGGSSSRWQQEAIGGFLLDLEMDELDDEAFLRICRETNRMYDLVDRLLSLGRIEEAVQATEQASDFELLSLADFFVQHKQGDLADKLVVERSKTTQDSRLLEWLKNRYTFRGNFAVALELAEKLFRDRPDFARYQELRELGRQTGQWEALRPQLLALLHEKGWNDLLVVIYLEEGEVDEALETLRTMGSRVMGYGYGLYGGQSLAIQVAKAAEETRPHAALEIYEKQVQRLIDGRQRQSYAEAARLLVRMRDIYTRNGESAAWSRYLEELREGHRALRALKEEMAAAGL